MTLYLPQVPESLHEDNPVVAKFLVRLLEEIESAFEERDQPYTLDWALSNVPASGSKTLDANAATADEVRKALVVLLRDLDNVGKATRA